MALRRPFILFVSGLILFAGSLAITKTPVRLWQRPAVHALKTDYFGRAVPRTDTELREQELLEQEMVVRDAESKSWIAAVKGLVKILGFLGLSVSAIAAVVLGLRGTRSLLGRASR